MRLTKGNAVYHRVTNVYGYNSCHHEQQQRQPQTPMEITRTGLKYADYFEYDQFEHCYG